MRFRIVFYGVFFSGAILSLFLRIVGEALWGDENILTVIAGLPKLFFAEGENLFLLSLINTVSTIFVAFLIRASYLQLKKEGHNQKTVVLKWAAIIPTVITLGIIIIVHTRAWYYCFKALPGSSTAPIGFLFWPIYLIFFVIPLGCVLGALIGLAVFKSTSKRS